jgi:hypothetical protein
MSGMSLAIPAQVAAMVEDLLLGSDRKLTDVSSKGRKLRHGAVWFRP